MTNVFKILIPISMLAVAVTFFYVVFSTLKDIYGKKDDIFNKINERYQAAGTMSYKKLMLSRKGVMYRVKNYDLTPGYYLVLKLTVGLIAATLGFLLFMKWYVLPIGFVIGYLGVPLYFKYENNKDNEEMMMDIYNTYANIKIQMGAGIYIRECLEYTYEMAINERYKEALKELVLNFSDKTVSSSDAVQIFKNRFNSQEIDKLSALIGSFLQYGLNANHTDDIMTEIQGLIQADTLKKEHDIEMKAEMVTFAFFGVIIAMIVFMIFSSFSLGGVF